MIHTALLSGMGMLFASNVKAYGNIKIRNDKFLTIVASCCSIANGLSRIIWGQLFDKYPFRTIILINVAVQLFVTSTVDFISSYKMLYLLWSVAVFFCFGGIFWF